MLVIGLLEILLINFVDLVFFGLESLFCNKNGEVVIVFSLWVRWVVLFMSGKMLIMIFGRLILVFGLLVVKMW